MFIRGEKLCLRALEPTDVELLYRWENDPAIWKISQTQKPFSHYTLQMFVEVSREELNKTGQLRLMVDLLPEEADQIPQTIGIVDIFEYDPFHQKAGLGILIHQDYRGNQYAHELLDLTLEYLFSTLLLHQVYCNIQEDNEISLNLFKKHGFQIVGLQKDWIRSAQGFQNVYLLQLINEKEKKQ